jgi:hypothetical protein
MSFTNFLYILEVDVHLYKEYKSIKGTWEFLNCHAYVFSRIHSGRCINHIEERLDSRYIAKKVTTPHTHPTRYIAKRQTTHPPKYSMINDSLPNILPSKNDEEM